MFTITRLSGLAAVTAVLGVAAVVALTIGRGIAVLALITIIGLPIYLAMAAIGPLFVLFLLALTVRAAIPGEGVLQTLAAFVGGALAMVAIPSALNVLTEREAAALVAGDKIGARASARPKTLGIVVGRRTTDECDDFCQRALLSGEISRFVVLKSNRDDLEPDAAAQGAAYRLEQRPVCAEVKIRDQLRLYPVARQEPAAAPALRLAMARGRCLVAERASLADVDALLIFAHLRRDSMAGGSFDPLARPMTASRASLRLRQGAALVETHRVTSLRYQVLGKVLIPVYIHGAELRTDAGLDRRTRQTGPERIDLDRLLQEWLGLALHTPATVAADQAATLDAVLAGGGRVAGVEQSIADDFFAGLARTGRTPDADGAARAFALLRDPRLTPAPALREFVRLAFRGDAALRNQTAAALFERLAAALAPGVDPKRREGDLRALAFGFAAIPDAAYPANWPRLRRFAHELPAADALAGEWRRAPLAGPSVAADLMATLDLVRPAGRFADEVRGRPGYYGALEGLCALGAAAADRAPQIEERLRRGALPARYPADWRALAQTLAALGGSPEILRETVRAEHLFNDLPRALDREIERARTKPHCRFAP